jgi:hypothetical protein
MTTVIAASCRLYRVFLFAYPPRLRDEFGFDMMSAFEQQLADAARDGGAIEVFRVWWRALWEMTHIGVLSRLAPASCSIAALSLVSSSALFLLFFWAAGFAQHCAK